MHRFKLSLTAAAATIALASCAKTTDTTVAEPTATDTAMARGRHDAGRC